MSNVPWIRINYPNIVVGAKQHLDDLQWKSLVEILSQAKIIRRLVPYLFTPGCLGRAKAHRRWPIHGCSETLTTPPLEDLKSENIPPATSPLEALKSENTPPTTPLPLEALESENTLPTTSHTQSPKT